MSRTRIRLAAVLACFCLVALACADDNKTTSSDSSEQPGTSTEKIGYVKSGWWDDGACDASKRKLKIGLMTVFESPIVSLKDQAQALEASAKAFNARGGANGSCIEVHTCDDGADIDQAVACVREIDEAGVV